MKKPRRLAPRVCANCGHNAGVEGPRTPDSHIRWIGDAMVFVCSTGCGQKLGWFKPASGR